MPERGVRVVDWVPEDSLPRDTGGRVTCARCRAVMESWSPIDGATWHDCPACGQSVLALARVQERAEATP